MDKVDALVEAATDIENLDLTIDLVYEAYIYNEQISNDTLGWIHQFLCEYRAAMEEQDKGEGRG
jgi:hypothetical protein